MANLPDPRRLRDKRADSSLSPAGLCWMAYDLRLGKEAGVVSLLFDDEIIWLVGPYDPAFNARLSRFEGNRTRILNGFDYEMHYLQELRRLALTTYLSRTRPAVMAR